MLQFLESKVTLSGVYATCYATSCGYICMSMNLIKVLISFLDIYVKYTVSGLAISNLELDELCPNR